MTISKINITTVNGTNTYSVKAPAIPVLDYDYEQCSPSQATGIAVLRYSPSVAEVVAGEYYANSSELIKYIPFTVEYDYSGVSLINIYLKKHSDATWLLYGKQIPASGQSLFALLPSDFIAGDDIDVKIEDADNATILDIIENQHVYITLTIDTYPSFTYLATNFSVSGKANIPDGSELTLRFSSLTGFQEYTIVVTNGAWLANVAQIDADHGFEPNQSIDIMIYGDNITADYLEVEDAFTSYATITMETPTGVVPGEDYDYSGTSNGDEVELFYSPAGEDDWTSLGTSVVVAGEWTISGSIPDAGTYNFKVEDTTDRDGNAQVDDVTVESAVVVNTLTIDASCTADAPSNI